jgi:hypothetical protein
MPNCQFCTQKSGLKNSGNKDGCNLLDFCLLHAAGAFLKFCTVVVLCANSVGNVVHLIVFSGAPLYNSRAFKTVNRQRFPSGISINPFHLPGRV